MNNAAECTMGQKIMQISEAHHLGCAKYPIGISYTSLYLVHR
jgi:hypothetical protein